MISFPFWDTNNEKLSASHNFASENIRPILLATWLTIICKTPQERAEMYASHCTKKWTFLWNPVLKFPDCIWSVQANYQNYATCDIVIRVASHFHPSLPSYNSHTTRLPHVTHQQLHLGTNPIGPAICDHPTLVLPKLLLVSVSDDALRFEKNWLLFATHDSRVRCRDDIP